MTVSWCSTCGVQLQAGASFCANCGTAVSQVTGDPGPTERQQLARAAMNVQTVQLLAYVGAGIGGAIGLLLPTFLLADTMGRTDPFYWVLVCIGSGLFGFFVGGRVALSLMAR